MALETGDKAPLFESKDQQGNPIKLADYKGKKIILYFYPRDNTKGCTAQACNLRDNHELLKKEGYEVIGVSTDDEKSHQKFIEKYDLPFPLVADTTQEVVQLYDVWKEKSMYGRKFMGIVRTTFLIDEDGIITDIIKKIKTAEHTAQIIS